MHQMNPTRRLSLLLPLLLLALTSPLALAAEGAPQENMNIIQTILHGGPLIVMIWIGILGTSMTMLTFIIQLFIVMRDEQLAPSALVESLQSTIHAGNYQEAWEICRANKAYIAQVLKGALERASGAARMRSRRRWSNTGSARPRTSKPRTATSR